MKILPLFPIYDQLKLGGHYACAFAAAIISAALLYAALVAMRRSNAFERACAFALWASGFIWVLPMHIKMSSETREIAVCCAVAACAFALKLLFDRNIIQTLALFAAFMLGQIAVFAMVYQKVF